MCNLRFADLLDAILMQRCSQTSMEMMGKNMLNKENPIGNLLNSLNVIFEKLESPLILESLKNSTMRNKTNKWEKATQALQMRTSLSAMLYENDNKLPNIGNLIQKSYPFVVNCTNAGGQWCLKSQFTQFVTSEYLTCYQYKPPDYTIFPGPQHGATITLFTGGEMLGRLSKNLKEVPGFNTPFFPGEGADGVRLLIHGAGNGGTYCHVPPTIGLQDTVA